jgi:hypothetical protein
MAEAAKDATVNVFEEVADNVGDTLTEAVNSGMDAFTIRPEQGGEALSNGLDSVMNLLTEGSTSSAASPGTSATC